jgi:pimeloyl-ACP methyl ester carboxylesterase
VGGADRAGRGRRYPPTCCGTGAARHESRLVTDWSSRFRTLECGAGFRGGINYYRNFQRNWDTTPQLAGAQIRQPVLFIAGSRDIVIRGASAEQLTAMMKPVAPNLRGVELIPGVGHWVQQESPAECNAAIVEFLRALTD